MAMLEIRNVSKFFGGLAANSDVSVSIEQGTIMGLIGPNGAGKTTLFNCITGYYPPSKGEVVFKGVRLNGLQPDQVCRLGMVRTWQKVRPLAKMTVLDNVMVGALVRTSSLKVAREVARVLATKPELLLLDEVMGGLNPTESDEMIELVLALRKAGLTFVVIEHDMRAIMRISDRVVVLDAGEKLAEGTPAEVVANREVVAAYLGEAP